MLVGRAAHVVFLLGPGLAGRRRRLPALLGFVPLPGRWGRVAVMATVVVMVVLAVIAVVLLMVAAWNDKDGWPQ